MDIKRIPRGRKREERAEKLQGNRRKDKHGHTDIGSQQQRQPRNRDDRSKDVKCL